MEGFVEYKKKHAGPSWRFLKFDFKEEPQHDYCFIVKNFNYFDEENFTVGRTPLNSPGGKEKKYLTNLVGINANKDFEIISERLNRPYQLTMEQYLTNEQDPNGKVSNATFNIVTYEIDKNSKLLKSIKVWLPNPETKKAILFRDLTPTLTELMQQDETYGMDEKEVEILKNVKDEDPVTEDPSTFGFEVWPNEITKDK